MGKIVGGWRLSSIGLWHTGHPLTVTMDLGGSISGGPFDGLPYSYLLPDGNDSTDQRPDLIPGVPLTLPNPRPATPFAPGAPLINAAAFQAPPLDANGNFIRYGNAAPGLIRALNYWQFDLALTKETKLTERVALEFAVQAFNIFNHVQLGDPGNFTLVYTPDKPENLSADSTFGVISSTVNFNNNNDNAASPNTGTGLPRQIQFMLRFKF
jgi:hypothetical protein